METVDVGARRVQSYLLRTYDWIARDSLSLNPGWHAHPGEPQTPVAWSGLVLARSVCVFLRRSVSRSVGQKEKGWVFFYANGFFSYAHSGVGVLLGYGFLFLCL